MPSYIVTAPDGKEYDVDAPEGATGEQALEYLNPSGNPHKPKKNSLLVRLGMLLKILQRQGLKVFLVQTKR